MVRKRTNSLRDKRVLYKLGYFVWLANTVPFHCPLLLQIPTNDLNSTIKWKSSIIETRKGRDRAAETMRNSCDELDEL